jgi:hypothetical protein
MVNKKTRLVNLKYIDQSQRKVHFLAVFLAPAMNRNRASSDPERQCRKRISHRAMELKHFLEHLACSDKNDMLAFVGHWVRNNTNQTIVPKPTIEPKTKRSSSAKKKIVVDGIELELDDD